MIYIIRGKHLKYSQYIQLAQDLTTNSFKNLLLLLLLLGQDIIDLTRVWAPPGQQQSPPAATKPAAAAATVSAVAEAGSTWGNSNSFSNDGWNSRWGTEVFKK